MTAETLSANPEKQTTSRSSKAEKVLLGGRDFFVHVLGQARILKKI